jgi:hypothetical protein
VLSVANNVMNMRIKLPHAKPIVKEVTLHSYVGRLSHQPFLRGDLPINISAIDGTATKEVYPPKDRSWLPYFIRNPHHVSQMRAVHSRSAGVRTPNQNRLGETNDTANKVLYTAVHAQSFVPNSPAPPAVEEEEKPTKIRVNLPPVTTTGSASPAGSDSSSLQVHHPRPTKQINIAEIDDTSARLKAMLSQGTSSPGGSHERTSSTALPETAVHAAPFRPSSFVPTTQPVPVAFPPVYYPPPFATDYTTTQPPYPQQRFESNGMVYYFDPSYYFFGQNGPQGQSQQQPPPTQNDASDAQRQMYFYPMGEVPRPPMGVYYPYQQQGT